MNNLKDLDELWGTTIYNLEIDYILQRCRFYIRLGDLGGSTLKFYELTFENMASFHMKCKEASPGQYPEFTEIYSEKNKNGYAFTILVLDEDYTIDIECESWKLTLLEDASD